MPTLDAHINAARGIVEIDTRAQQKLIANERIKKSRYTGYPKTCKTESKASPAIFLLEIGIVLALIAAISRLS